MGRTYVDTTPWRGDDFSIDRELVDFLIQCLVERQLDEDKAGDAEDAAFWEGCKDTYQHVLDLLFGIERDVRGNIVMGVERQPSPIEPSTD